MPEDSKYKPQVTLSGLSGAAIASLADLKGVSVAKLCADILDRYAASEQFLEDRDMALKVRELLDLTEEKD